MTSLAVYRSKDVRVISAWQEVTENIRAYVARTTEILAAAGAGTCQAVRDTSGHCPGRFVGLAIPADTELPPGWQISGGHAIPDRSRAAGRWIAAALDAAKHPGDPRQALIGMPAEALTPGGLISCGARLLEHGTVLFVTWSGPDLPEGPFSGPEAEINFALWERVPPAEYYLAAEWAGDDAAKVGAR